MQAYVEAQIQPTALNQAKLQKQPVKAWFLALNFENSSIVGKLIDTIKLSVVFIKSLLLPCFFVKVSASDLLFTSIIIKKIILKKLHGFGVLLQAPISFLEKV